MSTFELETQCHIAPNLVLPYVWEQRFARKGTESPAFAFLAHRCIAMGTGYMVKRPAGAWESYPKAIQARQNVGQYWQGIRKDGRTITAGDIESFFGPSGGIPMFHGEIVAPGLPEFVTFKGQHLLNVYRDERVRPDPDQIEAATPILNIISTLCDLLPETTPNEIIQDALGDDQASISRWVLHWIASTYRCPGKHIPVALCFVGPNRGCGKGTLGTIISTLVGQSWSKLFSTDELERGWPNMDRALFITMDEVQAMPRRDLFNFLSQAIANPTTSCPVRYRGPVEFPTVANIYITTNSTTFVDLPPTDRRLMIIHTTDDIGRNQHAENFHKLSPEQQANAIRGFAAILCSLDIDHARISKPLDTPLRQELMEVHMNAVERWFYDTDGQWVVDEMRSFEDIESAFRGWQQAQGDRGHYAQRTIAMTLNEYVRKGYFKAKKVSRSHYIKQRYFRADTEMILGALSDPKRVESRRILADSILDRLGGRNLADLCQEELRELSDDFAKYLAHSKARLEHYGVPTLG